MCHPATNKVTLKKRQTLPEDKIDLVGCFLPWNSSHFAGLNARRFMNNPKDNVDVCHPATNKVTTKKRQTLFAFPTKPAKVMASETPPSSSKRLDSNQNQRKVEQDDNILYNKQIF